MALLDLAGKYHHAPAHALLGGQYRNELPIAWVAYIRSAAALAGLAAAAPLGLTAACLGYGLGLAVIFLPAAIRRLTRTTPSASLTQGAMS